MAKPHLSFTVAADTSSAEGAVKRVGAAFNEMGGAAASMIPKLEKADAEAARIAKTFGIELSSSMDRSVQKLEALHAHLVKTGAPASDLHKVTLALEDAQSKYGKALTTTITQMGVWEQHGVAIARTTGAMAVAAGAYGVIAVKAFGESQEVVAKLDAVLVATGRSTDGTKQQVLALSDALSKVTPFDDEVITSGQTLLLTFRNISQDVLPRATKAMLDLATATGQDVPSAARMLGKALDQPAEGFSALARATGKFSEAQVQSIKSMVDMGETSKAQSTILGILEGKFGGMAEAAGKTLPGQLKIAQTAAGNFNEEIGGKLAPTIQGLITDFPNLTAAAVGVHDAWGQLNISGGELLIAVPLLKDAFGTGGLAGALGIAAKGAAVFGVAIASWEIGRMVGQIEIFGVTIDDLAEKFFKLTVFQVENARATIDNQKATDMHARVTASLEKETKALGLTVQRGSDSQERYNGRLMEAIKHHKASEAAQASSNKVALSHVLTLQQQIDKQRALIEKLSHLEGQEERLTVETAKLDAMLKKSGDSAKHAQQELDKLAGVFGVKLQPAIQGSTADFEKVHVALMKAGKSAGELEHDLLVMADAANKANESKKTLTQRTEDWINSAEREHEALMRNVAAIDKMKAATVALSEAPDPLISTNATLEAQSKHVADVLQGWGKLQEKIGITDEVVKPAKQSFEDFGRQVSTVVTDLGKGVADALVKWEGFGDSMIKIAREFGSGILRTLIETWFKPLEELLQTVAKKMTDFLGGIFGGGSGAAGGGKFSWGDFAKNLGIGGLVAGAGVGVSALISRLTRRGREKTEATGAAEGLSDEFWKGIFPEVQAGRMSVDEGLTALNAAWDNYVKFLNSTLKDQTVIQRSIEGQRVTLTEGTAALEKLRSTLADAESQRQIEAAVTNLQKLGAQFIETGEMSEDFAKAVTDAGGSVEFFNKMAGEVERLQGLRQEFGSLREMISSLLPPIKTWQQEFFETGKITEEMAAKIKEAGGDLEAFKKFAEMRQLKTELSGIASEFEKTGVVTGRMIDLLKQFASPELFAEFMRSLEVTGQAVRKEMDAAFNSTQSGITKMIDSFDLLRNEFDKNKTVSAEALAMIRKFADPIVLDAFEKLIIESGKSGKSLSQLGLESKEAASVLSKAFTSASENIKNLQQNFRILKGRFEETGEVSDKFLEILREYASKETLAPFEDLIALAKESGVNMLDLAKTSSVSADIIKKVFGSASDAIDKEFTNAAKSLSDTLAKMDENLGKAIESLQAAMVTMIKNLIDVILGVPGAAKKAADDANFFLGGIRAPEIRINISTHFDDSGLREAERRAATLAGIGFTPQPGTNTTGAGVSSGGGIFPGQEAIDPRIPRFAEGTDFVPRTGLAVVHRGEAIIPAGENRSGVTINIERVETNDPKALMAGLLHLAKTNRGGFKESFIREMRLN